MTNQIEVYVVGEVAADECDWLLRQTYYIIHGFGPYPRWQSRPERRPWDDF